jgi:hypothetical protein
VYDEASDSVLNRRQTYLTGALYVVISAAFCWPFFSQPLSSGSGDWDVHLFYYAAVLRNAAFGDLPFWNPWYCGGNVLWANPQASLVSPVYLLSLAMPITLAMKLNVFGHYVAGLLGMHVVLRRLVGLRSTAAIVYLASLFVFAGAITMRVRAGHTVFLPVFLLPWVIYYFWQAASRTRAVILGAAILGFMVLNGGMHVLPMTVVLLGVLGLGALMTGRIRPLVCAVAIVVLGCAYAAPKIVPVVLFVRGADIHDTRPVKNPDYMSMEMFRIALFDGSQTTRVKVSPGVQLYGWHEYSNYLGWFGGLALVSAAWILAFRRRDDWRAVSAALALIVVLVLAAGQFATYAPASVMRDLPFFSSFRIPSRYMMLVPLVGALCMAFAARALEATPRAALRRAIEILCVIGVCEIGLVNRKHLKEIFILPVDTQSRLFDRTPPIVTPHPVVTPGPLVHRTFMLDSMLVGVSPLNCYEPLQVKKVAEPGPVAIRGDGDVTLFGATFLPNKVAATAAVGRDPARAVLNQNFAQGWSSNVGRTERDPVSGQPSVVLPGGYSGPIVFSFVPPGLWMGLSASLAALVLSIVVWRRAKNESLPSPDAVSGATGREDPEPAVRPL